MKVIVLGASGFIGSSVAQAFTRGGHIVYGTTRSSSTANSLAKQEILPIVLDPTTKEGLEKLVELAIYVDVVIDTIPAMGPEVPLATFHAIVAAVEKRPVGAKLAYIYTGGSWVHARGMGGLDKWTDERQPYGSASALTQWRWKVEEQVLSGELPGEAVLIVTATLVQGIVVRPSVLYGKSGSLSSMLVFAPTQSAGKGQTVKLVGRPESRLLTIHADDLADLYLRVAERVSATVSYADIQAPICKGQAFLGCNPYSERLLDLYDAVVRVSGAKGYELQAPSNQAWASTTLAKPSLGEALSGWRPKKMGLVDGIDIYWEAFKAFSDK